MHSNVSSSFFLWFVFFILLPQREIENGKQFYATMQRYLETILQRKNLGMQKYFTVKLFYLLFLFLWVQLVKYAWIERSWIRRYFPRQLYRNNLINARLFQYDKGLQEETFAMRFMHKLETNRVSQYGILEPCFYADCFENFSFVFATHI